MERLRVPITLPELQALEHLAANEVRPVPDQARAILRERLREVGLLPDDDKAATTGTAVPNAR